MLPIVKNPLSLSKEISAYWDPHVIARLNGQELRLAKLKGEFVWHSHEHEDELFMVLQGSLKIEFEAGTIHLNAGDLAVVPKGKMHRPVAEEEVLVLLFEPAATINTGTSDAGGYTRTQLKEL